MPVAQDEQEAVEAVLDWAREVIPELVAGYDFATASKDQGLPDVVVECETVRCVRSDPRFVHPALQHRWLDVFEVVCSIMVDNSAQQQAARDLREWSRRLREVARRDGTLGGRVFLASAQLETDYVPQFVEYEDGTRGRQAVTRIPVAALREGR